MRPIFCPARERAQAYVRNESRSEQKVQVFFACSMAFSYIFVEVARRTEHEGAFLPMPLTSTFVSAQCLPITDTMVHRPSPPQGTENKPTTRGVLRSPCDTALFVNRSGRRGGGDKVPRETPGASDGGRRTGGAEGGKQIANQRE